MPLKQDRYYTEEQTAIDYFMNATSSRGIIVVHDTAVTGSGAHDDANALVKVPGTASGSRPAGLLLCDVVNKDLSKTHLNAHKDEVQIGGKVVLLRGGPGAWVRTNNISGTPTAGAKAYYNNNGELTPTALAGVDQVGRFGSAVDSDGYAKVYINIV